MVTKTGGQGGRARMPRSARRASLLEAARGTFVVCGYHAASMDDIAVRAGVSKPVLYQHFPGKLELYLALLDHAAEELVGAVREALASTTDNRARVDATVRAYLAFVAGDGLHRLVFESDLRSEPLVAERVERMMREAVGEIARTIGADTGVDATEARLLSVGLAGMAEVAARWWLAQGGPDDPAEEAVTIERAAELLAQLAWRGISGSPKRP